MGQMQIPVVLLPHLKIAYAPIKRHCHTDQARYS